VGGTKAGFTSFCDAMSEPNRADGVILWEPIGISELSASAVTTL